MEETRKKQENVRDFLRENSEAIERIKVLAMDNLRIIVGDINSEECRREEANNMDRNLLEQTISQREGLQEIIKMLEEARVRLIG